MRVIMNLEVSDGTRVRAAYNIGKLFGPDVEVETVPVQYPGKDGETVVTDCMVIAGDLPGETYACGAAYSLAIAFEQDAVAMYIPDKHLGFLVGPAAAQWPAFDLAFFKLPTPKKGGGLVLVRS